MTMSKLVESLVNTVIRTMALTNTEVAAVTEQLNHDLLMTAKMFPIWLQKQIQKGSGLILTGSLSVVLNK